MKLSGNISETDAINAASNFRKTKASYRIRGETCETLKIYAKTDAFYAALEEVFDSVGLTAWVEKHPTMDPTFKRQMDPAPIPEGGTGKQGGPLGIGEIWEQTKFIPEEYAWKDTALIQTDQLKYPKVPFCHLPVRVRFSTEGVMLEGMYLLEKYGSHFGLTLLSAGCTSQNTLDMALALWYTDFPNLEKANADYITKMGVCGFMEKLEEKDL